MVKTIVKQTRKNLKDSLSEIIVTRTSPSKPSPPPDPTADPHHWLLLAANAGHTEAMVRAGNHHLALSNVPGSPAPGDLRAAVEWYERAAGESNEANFNLGHLYFEGSARNGMEKDEGRAMVHFRRAALGGDMDAAYFVGVTGGDLEMIERAAGKGHGGAMYYLALHNYNDGSEEVARLSRFREEIRAAAEEGGDGDAMAVLADCCFKGTDGFELTTESHGEALKWWLKASDAGNADAAISAGALLFRGSPPGVKQDKPAAFQLYQRAGELGSIDGWRNVAACYSGGEGVPKCEASARYIVETMIVGEKAAAV